MPAAVKLISRTRRRSLPSPDSDRGCSGPAAAAAEKACPETTQKRGRYRQPHNRQRGDHLRTTHLAPEFRHPRQPLLERGIHRRAQPAVMSDIQSIESSQVGHRRGQRPGQVVVVENQVYDPTDAVRLDAVPAIERLISKLPYEAVEAVRRVLRGEPLVNPQEAFTCVRSLPHDHVAAVLGTLEQLGLHTLLARQGSRIRDLAVALIAARVITRSRSWPRPAPSPPRAPSPHWARCSEWVRSTSTNSTRRWTGWSNARQPSSNAWPNGTLRTTRWCSTTSRPAIWKAVTARWPGAATAATARRAPCEPRPPRAGPHVAPAPKLSAVAEARRDQARPAAGRRPTGAEAARPVAEAAPDLSD